MKMLKQPINLVDEKRIISVGSKISILNLGSQKFLFTLGLLVLGYLVFIQDIYADSDLIIESNRKFVVTYPDNSLAVEKAAAEELAKYMEQVFSTKTEIKPESKLEKENQADAYIGKCKLTQKQNFYIKELKQEEFNIILKDSKLFIYGDDGTGAPFAPENKTGTLFGVYDFLENEIGITWIWPGKTGEDIPNIKNLRLKEFSRVESPKLLYRWMRFSPAAKDPIAFKDDCKYWFKRMKLSFVPKLWTGHSWDSYIFKTGMKDKHPEWLALWAGKRKEPHCCTSNKEFRDYIVEQCLNNPFNKNKWIVSISPSDGWGFCECEKCRALDLKGTDYSSSQPNLSNRHWDYANYIAKKVKEKDPAKNIAMFAYTAYRDSPTNIDKFEDNLYVAMCHSAAYNVNSEMKKTIIENIKSFNSKGAKLLLYEYWGMHYWLDLPYIFTKQMAEFMPFMYRNGLIGIEAESQKNFSTQGPNYYLGCHLMWNPEANSDKILERYYNAFGPASDYIKDYYNIFEISIQENLKSDFTYLRLINSWPQTFPEKTLVRAGECIQKAKDAVKGNPILEERVKIVAIGYQYTKTMLELIEVYKKLGRAGVPLYFFGYQGAVAEQKHWSLPEMPKHYANFWKEHPEINIAKEEKLKLLKRALELGNERERLLYVYDDLPALSRGMYKYYFPQMPLHEIIRDELKKENIKEGIY